jgi:hypothetical protein
MNKKIEVNGRMYDVKDLTIEIAYSKYANPNPGPDEWAIYHHFTHKRGSVLSGQRGRQVLGWGTLGELKTQYPGVEVCGGTSYIDPDEVIPSGKPSDYEEAYDEDDY